MVVLWCDLIFKVSKEIESMKKSQTKISQAKIKRALTLVEMIVVIMILTMITGALAYNYKDSIGRGKDFKKAEMISRLQAFLDMELAGGYITDPAQVGTTWKTLVEAKPVITKNPRKFGTDADQLGITVSYDNATKEITVQ